MPDPAHDMNKAGFRYFKNFDDFVPKNRKSPSKLDFDNHREKVTYARCKTFRSRPIFVDFSLIIGVFLGNTGPTGRSTTITSITPTNHS